ncbi:hypothetical protein BGZ80_006469 [Entomortierella chlamydospora]|uniref:Uncharacterized protein n=1 Tax=Entomortierella chlamydospora TaxID=101097 RepID=A0A9P6MHB0_9FUNG|nr:hypothetical protein BGZ80_006469 [Entomortierella chlamydospora]
MVTYLTIPTWVVRFGLCIWLVTTITGKDNAAGYVCDTSMDYNLSAIMQYIKIATEIIILVFFLERVIALHRSSVQTDSNHSHWRRLALINAGITFLVILFEILVGQVTVYLQDYLFLTYSMVNLIQATLVIFVVEDTKNVFKKRAATSNSASKQSNSNSGNHANSQRDNMDDTTISYTDGVSAKAGRLNDPYSNNLASSQQPWSLTMRAPTSTPDAVSVNYQPNSRPHSTFYDFGQMDQKMSPNRHWDVDVESQDTIDGNNRWKYGKNEDEIPMTLAKRREDAQSPHSFQSPHSPR